MRSILLTIVLCFVIIAACTPKERTVATGEVISIHKVDITGDTTLISKEVEISGARFVFFPQKYFIKALVDYLDGESKIENFKVSPDDLMNFLPKSKIKIVVYEVPIFGIISAKVHPKSWKEEE